MKMATEILKPFGAGNTQTTFLPFSAPWFGDEEKSEVLETLAFRLDHNRATHQEV